MKLPKKMLFPIIALMLGCCVAIPCIAAAATPVAGFSGTPTIGSAPLTVAFSDSSTGSPTGRAWYFGDEDYTEPWNLVTASAGWSPRLQHNSVALPDGSIVIMGGLVIPCPVCGYTNEVWRSTDNGVTWTQLPNGGWSPRGGYSSVAMPDSSIVLMGGAYYFNDVWRSTDSTTWKQMTSSAEWSGRYHHSSVAMPDGSIILMGGSGYRNDVWRSIDNGEKWTLVTPSAEWSGRFGQSTVVLQDGSIILMGGANSTGILQNDVWRSTDSGKKWTLMTASAEWSGRNFPSPVVMPDGSIVVIGGWNGTFTNDVWRSTDNGTTWTQLPNGGWAPRCWDTSVAVPNGSIILMGGEDSGGLKNDVWQFKPTGSSAQNPSHTYTKPGIYQVSLQVYNTVGYNNTQKTGYITVVNTPAQSVQELTTKIDGLGLPSNIEQGLIDKLIAAQEKIAQNHNTPARQILFAFINQVNSQRGKTLTNAQAEDLVAIVQQIIDSIPGK